MLGRGAGGQVVPAEGLMESGNHLCCSRLSTNEVRFDCLTNLVIDFQVGDSSVLEPKV
jgi:hypothetical protein